jgi:hypothetical protein
MESFCKTEQCPASEKLAALRDSAKDEDVIRHLEKCEFCTAELEFYRRYPPREEKVEVEAATIPEPLFELADALLHKQKDLADLYKLAGRRG